MSLITWMTGFSSSKRQNRRRSRRPSTAPKRKLRFYGGGLGGIECLEGRAMLSAISVNESGATGPVTIDVSTSGSNTLVSVNGTIVDDVASSSISSLSITGSAYNDTIAFDYTGGNPVPDGSISVNGGGGTDTLSVTASANFDLGPSQVTLSGGDTSTIDTSNVTQATLIGGSGTTYMTVDGWAGDATVDLMSGANTVAYLYALSGTTGNDFSAEPTTSTLSGTNYSYTTNGVGSVFAYGNGGTDHASLGDSGTSGTAWLYGSYDYISGTASGSNYTLQADGFPDTTIYSSNSSDTATFKDSGWGGSASGSMTPDYSYLAGGAGYFPEAAGFHSVTMDAQYNSDTVNMNDQYSSGTLYSHAATTAFDGPGYANVANNFGHVTATSYNSSDVAYMDDSGATAAGNFYSYPTYSYWQGSISSGGFDNEAVSFKTIYSESYVSGDYAWYTDTAGGAALYANGGNPAQQEMVYGNGNTVIVWNFGSYGNPHVSANAALPAGEYDVAQSVLTPYVAFYGNWVYD